MHISASHDRACAQLLAHLLRLGRLSAAGATPGTRGFLSAARTSQLDSADSFLNLANTVFETRYRSFLKVLSGCAQRYVKLVPFRLLTPCRSYFTAARVAPHRKATSIGSNFVNLTLVSKTLRSDVANCQRLQNDRSALPATAFRRALARRCG